MLSAATHACPHFLRVSRPNGRPLAAVQLSRIEALLPSIFYHFPYCLIIFFFRWGGDYHWTAKKQKASAWFPRVWLAPDGNQTTCPPCPQLSFHARHSTVYIMLTIKKSIVQVDVSYYVKNRFKKQWAQELLIVFSLRAEMNKLWLLILASTNDGRLLKTNKCSIFFFAPSLS